MVDSEIASPNQPPVMVKGSLRAFYVLKNHERLILARVTTTAPLPLAYVIPFAIKRGRGAFGTILVARHMHELLGVCIHPHCFSPYTLKGVYSRISKFGLSLRRRFTRHGTEDSFVEAKCPAATLPLLRAQLSYRTGGTARGTILRPCRATSE